MSSPYLNGNLSHGYNFGRTIDPFTNQFVESSAIRSNSFGLSTGMVLFNGFQNHLNLRRQNWPRNQPQPNGKLP